MALIESPEKPPEDEGNLPPVIHQQPSPASQPSAPTASHSDLLSVLSGAGLKLLQHVSSHHLPPRHMPSSGLPLSAMTLPTQHCRSPPSPASAHGNLSRTLQISREHAPPSQPYPTYSSSLPSRAILQSQSSPPPPPPPPSLSSGQLPQTRHMVHSGLKSMWLIQTAMVQSSRQLRPPVAGQDVYSRSSSTLEAFSGSVRPLASRNIPQFNANHTIRLMQLSGSGTVPQSSDSVINSFAQTLKARLARVPHHASQSSTPWSSIRPPSENCPGGTDTNPKPVSSYRFPPPSNRSPHPAQFPSVPGTRFVSPPSGINSGMHPAYRIRPPRYQLPHGSTLQAPNAYGAGHRTRFLGDTSRFSCVGESTNSALNTGHCLLKKYSEAAGAVLDDKKFLPVGTDPHPKLNELSKPTTRFPFEQRNPGSTVFAGSSSGMRPFQTTQSHTLTATSNFRHMQRPLRDSSSLARPSISNVHPQVGPFRNTQPLASLRQESPNENTIARATNARQLPQSTTGRYYGEKNVQQSVGANHTAATNASRGQDFELTRTNPVSTVTAIQHSSVSSTMVSVLLDLYDFIVFSYFSFAKFYLLLIFVNS